MPRGDRTGPSGMGPMTGRGAGFCAGNAMPGYANPVGGRGFWGGRGGRGGGRGWRNMFYATGLPGWLRFGAWGAAPTPPQEADVLEAQAGNLREALANIEKRLEEIKGGDQ